MIIKQLTLHNFRQFQDTQTLTFSEDKTKNITLILGDNTSGKTTLLQAFLWCFYSTTNFKSKDSLLNAAIAQEVIKQNSGATVSVSIDLEHQDIYYTVTRKLRYVASGDKLTTDGSSAATMTLKTADGKTSEIPNLKVKEKIEEILPKKLAIYFLYDTERFGNVSSREDVTNSVKQILGLAVLEKAIDYLGTATRKNTVLHQLNANLNHDGDNKAQDLLNIITTAEENLTMAEEQIANKRSEIEYYKQKIDEKQNILRGLEKSASLQNEKEKKMQALAYEQDSLKSCETTFYNSFKNNSFAYLGTHLLKRANEELATAKLDNKAIRDMNANAIIDIIERGYCVCGSEVCQGNNAHKHLLDEIRYLPPESIGTLLRIFKDKIDTYSTSCENYYSILESCYKNILSTNYRIGEIEDEIQIINNDIMELGQEDIKLHQQDLTEAENKHKYLNEEIDELNQKIGEYKNTITNTRIAYNKAISASSKNKEILTYMKYADEVLNWLKDRKENRETDIKQQLEDRVNYYFEKMYHGKRKVEIDNKFRVSLITTDLEKETHTDESQGLETVKNFAFISGLVDLAKQKLKDAYEKDAEDYPLILDAPFSNADEKHVKNISEVLPNVANQLILIVMAKDWNYAKESLSSRIGQEYVLDKKSEIYTKVEGVNIHANI